MTAPYSTPSYGPTYDQYAPPPPPYSNGPIRPRLTAVWVTWLIFVGTIVAAVVLGMSVFKSMSDLIPTTTFGSGETVKVRIDPADKPAIWASAAQPTNVECQVVGTPDQKITLTQPGGSQSVSLNGANWEVLFKVGVPAAGDYQVSCDGAGVKFGIAEEFSGKAVGSIVGGSLLLVGLPVVGFLLAVVTTIVVLVRRSGARRRQRMY